MTVCGENDVVVGDSLGVLEYESVLFEYEVKELESAVQYHGQYVLNDMLGLCILASKKWKDFPVLASADQHLGHKSFLGWLHSTKEYLPVLSDGLI